MAAAMELSRADKKSLVIEKAKSVGGLSKTLSFDHPEGTYRTDIGPHRFFSKNKYLYAFLEDLLDEDWMSVPRLTRFYVDGHFYLYPVQLTDVLRNIGPRRAFAILRDYIVERVRGIVRPRCIDSFEAYVVSQFGRSLAEFNMLNYTEKIWGIPCHRISVDWATQRIGGLSFWAVIRKALLKKGGPKSLVDTFYYPSRGTGLIYERIRERIEEKGSEVCTSAEPVAIYWEGKTVTTVEIEQEGVRRTVHPSAVINSVPLTRTLELFQPAPPQDVLDAAKRLRFRAQVYLFLTVDREQIMRDNWVYFPDKAIPFGRISEMKNFSKQMCPPGKTSLFVEYFCFEGDDIWQASQEELFDQAIVWLEKLGILTRTDVLSVHHFRQQNVYPVYDLQYAENAHTVTTWLDSFENFYAVGRPGRFRYTNQDHSLEMGILAAQSVLDGRRRNIDEVGIEQEYFEKGYVPEKKPKEA